MAAPSQLNPIRRALVKRALDASSTAGRASTLAHVGKPYGEKPYVLAWPVSIAYQPTLSGVDYANAIFRVVFAHPLGPSFSPDVAFATNLDDLDAFVRDLADTNAITATADDGGGVLGGLASHSFPISQDGDSNHVWHAVEVEITYDA